MNQDRVIKCADCGQEFAWTAGEQEFYESKGLDEPKYCMICRGVRAARERDLARFGKKKQANDE